MNKFWLALAVSILATLACGRSTTQPRRIDLYPTETILATQTERVIVWTQTPADTATPILVIISATPDTGLLCVRASVAVYLRPSPDTDNYPIMPLANGAQVRDLGGRSGRWYFVAVDNKQGWINGDYLVACE